MDVKASFHLNCPHLIQVMLLIWVACLMDVIVTLHLIFHTYESNTESNSVLSGYFKIDSTSINKFVTDDKTMITDMFKRCIILKSF